MATLNQAVQSMIDNLHQKMISDTPLSAEEQTLVAKALEALRNNYTWEQAIVAVAEHHINESKAALEAALADTQSANTALEDKTSELVSRYGYLRVVGHDVKSDLKGEFTFTPPKGCRVRVKELFCQDGSSSRITTPSTRSTRCVIKAGSTSILGSRGEVSGLADYSPTYNSKYIRVGERVSHEGNSYPASHSELLLDVDTPFYIKVTGSNYVCVMVEYVTDK